MSFDKSTNDMYCLLKSIMDDIPKIHKGNKLAAQRVRCATIELSKVSKNWRKLSIQKEKQ
jgi:hypothetical protein